MIQQTSLLAYAEAKKGLGKKQQLVLEALEEIQPASNRMIAKHLGWEINSVTPRCLELRQRGKVVFAEQSMDEYGKKVNFWKPRKAYEPMERDC
jgi:DNA-binding MarR family transcriptional regulator